MRILHVIESTNPEGGGPIEAIRQAARALSGLGATSEIACLDSPDADWLPEIDLPVHALGPTVSRYGYSRQLGPWLRRHGPTFDSTIVHKLWRYTTFAVWKAYRRLNLSYCVYPHGSLDAAIRRVFPVKHLQKQLIWLAAERRVLRDAEMVFFTCEQERQLARRTFWPHLNTRNSKIMPYCLAAPPGQCESQVASFRRRFPQLADRRLLLFLSRIHPKKGCDIVLRCFAKVASEDERLHLVMAGPYCSDSYRDQLHRLARSLGISRRVTWAGMLKNDVKWGAFRSAELFLLPSHQENFGIAVAEALACELPVLISDKVNIWQEIEQDGGGHVCDDTVDSARAGLVKWLALSKESRRQMRRRALRCFENRFSVQHTAGQLYANLSAVTPKRQIA